MKSINTRISLSDVRPELASLSLFEITVLLRSLGWAYNLETAGETAFVEFAMEDWSPLWFTFGYVCNSLKESDILDTSKRAAELCMRLSEAFAGTYPNDFVSKDGFIYEDVETSALKSQGDLAILEFNNKRSTLRAEEDVSKTDVISLRYGRYVKIKGGRGFDMFTVESLPDLAYIMSEVKNRIEND